MVETAFFFKIEDAGTGARFTNEERTTVTKSTDDAIAWMSDNLNATETQYKDKLKEVEGTCKTIIMGMFANVFPGQMNATRQFPRPSDPGPRIDERD